MTIRTAIDLIKSHEGCRLTAYRDTLGKLTIGYGRCVPGIKSGDTCTQASADAWLDDAVKVAGAGAVRVCQRAGINWAALSEPRRAVLTDMAYQLGEGGLGAFRNMLGAIKGEMWIAAATAGLASMWAKQTPNRAHQNMTIMQSGEWPG